VTVPVNLSTPACRVCETLSVTCTATLSVAIVLTTGGTSSVATRSWAVCCSPMNGNWKPPVALVTCGLPTVWKPAVNGNGLACRTTSWLALPVPLSVPST